MDTTFYPILPANIDTGLPQLSAKQRKMRAADPQRPGH